MMSFGKESLQAVVLPVLIMLLLGEYAESPKGLKVGDRVKVDVSVKRLEELQRQRDAWDPELTKVGSALNRDQVKWLFVQDNLGKSVPVR